MNLNKNFNSFIFALFLSVSLFAQNVGVEKDSTHTQVLDGVIISATRTERQLSSLPLPAQIISEKEIESTNSVRVGDILNEQTGLVTVPDFGGGEGIQLQGLDSQYTLILVDGAPLIGRSAGTLDVCRLAVGNMKQVEVVKGASSSLYGSEALGGVVNIITKDPKEGLKISLDNRYATNSTQDSNFTLDQKKGKFSVSAFANRYSSDGYDLIPDDDIKTVDPFTNYTFNVKLKYQFSDHTDLAVSGRYYIEEQDYRPVEDLIGESSIDEWNTQVKLNTAFGDRWKTTFEFYTTQYKTDEYLNNLDGTLNSISDYNHVLVRPEFRATYQLDKKNTFVGGVGMNHETLDRTYFTFQPEFNSQYVFVQYDGNPTESLNIIVGGRFDNHSEYNSQFSPKAAVRYNLSEQLAVKGSVGYGFKAPDFRQLYFDFTNSSVGYTVIGYNMVTTRLPQMDDQGLLAIITVPVTDFEKDLKAENSVGINVGFSYKPVSEVVVDVNLFRNNIQDLIDTRVIANKTNGQNVFSYYNVNQVFTQGVEFNTTWKPNKDLRLSTGYQLLYAKDDEAVDAFESNNVYARDPNTLQTFLLKKSDYYGLYNRSRHMANFKVFYTITDWDLDTNLRATYRSKYGLFDSNGNNYLDKYDDFVSGYSVLDIAFNKAFGETFDLGLGIDNILDFTDTQNISNIPGRIIYGKLKIKF